MEPEVVDRAAPISTEHAGGMCVVDEHRGIRGLGRVDDRRQRRDVAVHAEHAVGHDEDQAIRTARSVPAALARVGEDLA